MFQLLRPQDRVQPAGPHPGVSPIVGPRRWSGMTYYELSRSAAEPHAFPPREPFPGEGEALESVAAAGRRAAGWLRSLPGPEDDNWISGDLADAIEEATQGLDPGDCDDADRWGDGGVPAALRERLDVAWSLTHVDWISPAHKAMVLAAAGAVLGMPKSLANDPVTALGKELPALCAVIDSAVAMGNGVAAGGAFVPLGRN